MQARETTSYKIIQKHLEKLSEKIGIKFELEEMGEYGEGQDIMHQVMIRPKKS